MAPTKVEVSERLAIGRALDRLWGETMGFQEGDPKERPLRMIADLLAKERVPYALIGGVAVQLHTSEPRTTLDIDLAVPTYAHIPAEALRRAGFEHTGRHEHSDDWRAPGTGSLRQRTAVQFSAEEAGIADAIEHAHVVDLGGGTLLRLASVADVIELELLAAQEPRRRASKREHDVADVIALLEEHPSLRSPTLLARLTDVRASLLAAGLGPT